ncbi:hypothetical protein CEXT_76141 [Caerostris extrusa]|uniref:Uncharacterized protein n=1 Tax=Caerostris extrusa TaxID=172846 RepID=A0AAV4Y7J6_CAEEX|nr:hypothetical protein CEXT_76141 [Caerostris extrusa]
MLNNINDSTSFLNVTFFHGVCLKDLSGNEIKLYELVNPIAFFLEPKQKFSSFKYKNPVAEIRFQGFNKSFHFSSLRKSEIEDVEFELHQLPLKCFFPNSTFYEGSSKDKKLRMPLRQDTFTTTLFCGAIWDNGTTYFLNRLVSIFRIIQNI